MRTDHIQKTHVITEYDVGIIGSVFFHKALGKFHLFRIVAVLENANNAAVLFLQSAVDFGKFRQFPDTPYAPGTPIIDHGDLICREKVLAADNIAVQICSLKTDHLSHGLRNRIHWGIILSTLKHFEDASLQSSSFLCIFLFKSGNLFIIVLGNIIVMELVC